MAFPEFGILLCAGLGVRLRPLTEQVPKPLMPFLDRAIASYSFQAMASAGVTTVGANAFHMHERFPAFLQAEVKRAATPNSVPVRTVLVEEDALRGTGGGARGVWERLGQPNGTLIVANGDIVADFPLQAMLKVHRRTGACATLMTRAHVPGEAAVFLDSNRHFVTTLPGHGDDHVSPDRAAVHGVTFGGVYILESRVLERIPAKGNTCLIRNGVGPALADGELVASTNYNGFWADLGTPSRFANATWDVLNDATVLPHGPVAARADHCYVPDRRSVHPSAVIEGPVYIAPGALIEAGAVVGPFAVVGNDCAVRTGATVRESVLMGGADIAGTLYRKLQYGEFSVRIT